MDLVLVISTSVAAIAAFLIGYIYGKKKQADKDKADVFSAFYEVTEKYVWNNQTESEDWVKGALEIDNRYFDAIFKVFYGEKSKCGSGRDKTTDEDDDLPEEL